MLSRAQTPYNIYKIIIVIYLYLFEIQSNTHRKSINFRYFSYKNTVISNTLHDEKSLTLLNHHR